MMSPELTVCRHGLASHLHGLADDRQILRDRRHGLANDLTGARELPALTRGLHAWSAEFARMDSWMTRRMDRMEKLERIVRDRT